MFQKMEEYVILLLIFTPKFVGMVVFLLMLF